MATKETRGSGRALTTMQQAFVEAFVETGDKLVSLRRAGYTAHIQAADRLLRTPHIAAEIDRRLSERLATEGVSVAIDTLITIARDPRRKDSDRITASRILLDRAGRGDAAAASGSLLEASPAEMARIAGDALQAIAAREQRLLELLDKPGDVIDLDPADVIDLDPADAPANSGVFG